MHEPSDPDVPRGTRPAWLEGRYELVALAGRGGMATVHLAYAHGAGGFKRRVAIKRLAAGVRAQPGVPEMLAEEARIVGSFEHPNVAQVLDVVPDPAGGYFLVMEWVEGVDLGRYISHLVRAGERVAWPEIVHVARCVVSALDAAHTRRGPDGRVAPVFHRDVTPSNVLLGVHGQVKLTDFGLARAMDRATITIPGIVKGKIAYLAPELLAGVRASAQTDLFSVGVVLWEALAGRRLHDSGNDLELFAKVGAAQIPDVRELRPDVPDALAEVVRRATARRTEDRYASGAEMESGLARVQAGPGRPFDPRDFAARVQSIRAALR